MRRNIENEQGGFTIIEVAFASVITLVGLVSLAGLFSLSISQNRLVKNYSLTTALSQEKLEQLTALERNDPRLAVGGSLTAPLIVGGITFSDEIYVSDDVKSADAGKVYITGAIPAGRAPQYRRYWSVQLIPALANSMLIGVRVVALQSSKNRIGTTAASGSEQTTLTTVRSW